MLSLNGRCELGRHIVCGRDIIAVLIGRNKRDQIAQRFLNSGEGIALGRVCDPMGHKAWVQGEAITDAIVIGVVLQHATIIDVAEQRCPVALHAKWV